MFIEPRAQKTRFAPAERDIPFLGQHIALLRSADSACSGLAINILPALRPSQILSANFRNRILAISLLNELTRPRSILAAVSDR